MATHDEEDDLFRHTSMTFGEHLEELRSALFKAVIALVIGFAIGLIFGSWIVAGIQDPLKSALETYYQKQGMEFVNARVSAELQDDPAIKKLVYDDGLLPEDRYVSATELIRALNEKIPGAFPKVGPPPAAQASEGAGAADAKGKRAAELQEFSRESMIRLRMWRPLADDERLKLDTLSVQEPFVIYLKASFLFGAIISSPFVLFYLWQFVAAGLYPHEKRYIHLFLPVSVGLFLLGASGAFFFVFPPVLGYFFWIGDSLGIQMRPRLSEWLSFVMLLPLGFGIAFQLPLVMLFLERVHILSVQIYLSKWRIAVLLMAVAAMVLSPGGDPYSMMMMLVPLIALYFGGIGLCKWLPGSRPRSTTKPKAEESADAD